MGSLLYADQVLGPELQADGCRHDEHGPLGLCSRPPQRRWRVRTLSPPTKAVPGPLNAGLAGRCCFCVKHSNLYLRKLFVHKQCTAAKGPRTCRARTSPLQRRCLHALGMCGPAVTLCFLAIESCPDQMNMAGNMWKKRLEQVLETRILEVKCKTNLAGRSAVCALL